MLNPCCCISPRIGAFIFGIIDLLFSISSLSMAMSQSRSGADKWFAVAVYVVMIILAICLIYGAVKNSIKELQIWLFGWVILVVLLIASQVLKLFSQPVASEQYQAYGNLGGILIFLYELWVVYAYIYELRYGASGLTYCPAQVV